MNESTRVTHAMTVKGYADSKNLQDFKNKTCKELIVYKAKMGMTQQSVSLFVDNIERYTANEYPSFVVVRHLVK